MTGPYVNLATLVVVLAVAAAACAPTAGADTVDRDKTLALRPKPWTCCVGWTGPPGACRVRMGRTRTTTSANAGTSWRGWRESDASSTAWSARWPTCRPIWNASRPATRYRATHYRAGPCGTWTLRGAWGPTPWHGWSSRLRTWTPGAACRRIVGLDGAGEVFPTPGASRHCAVS